MKLEVLVIIVVVTLTKPCFLKVLASSMLECHSMDVSPRPIRWQCHPVSTPSAKVTVEQSIKTYRTLLCSDSETPSASWLNFFCWRKRSIGNSKTVIVIVMGTVMIPERLN